MIYIIRPHALLQRWYLTMLYENNYDFTFKQLKIKLFLWIVSFYSCGEDTSSLLCQFTPSVNFFHSQIPNVSDIISEESAAHIL